jgi:hypothetical protein
LSGVKSTGAPPDVHLWLEQTPVEAAPKVFGAANKEMQATRLFGYRSGAGSATTVKTKSRHAVKRDGWL